MAAHRGVGSFLCTLAVVTSILLSGHLVPAAEISEAQKRSPAAGSDDAPAVGAQGGASQKELSRSDLVEALEKLSSRRLGAGGDKGTSESMFGSGRDGLAGAADKPSAAAGQASATELLHRLASMDDRILLDKSDTPKSSAVVGGGYADQRPADRLNALLATLGGGARDDERRFFSNAGGRGKKEELEPASTARLYEAVRELTGFVRDLVVLYKEEKEETEKTFSTITQIIEKLTAYHAK